MHAHVLALALAVAGAGRALAAGPQVADESACPYYSVDIAAFYSCAATSGGEAALPVAIGEEQVPVARRTVLGLYTDAAGAYRWKTTAGAEVTLVDLRSDDELNDRGGPESVDARVAWPRGMQAEAAAEIFVAEFERTGATLGLQRDSSVLLICASGRRSTLATNALARAGYTRVTNVIDGYEGDEGLGLLGWRRAGLPQFASRRP